MTGHSPAPVLAVIAVGVFVSVLSATLLLRGNDAAGASGARAQLTSIAPPLLSPVSALPDLQRLEPAPTPPSRERTAPRPRAAVRPAAPSVAPTSTPVAPAPTVAAPRPAPAVAAPRPAPATPAPAPAAPAPTRSPSNVGESFDSSG